MLKRLFDIAVSLAALLFLAGPFLVIMLLLRFSGERRVWFLQERIGYQGRRFKLIKFATMMATSERIGPGEITLRDDPRVLPIGRFLRRAKLNELPQFINVLKGDLSLVGWRPLVPSGFALYPKAVQEQIVRMKPGLTGLGSIVFRDEEQIVTDAAKRGTDLLTCYRELIIPRKSILELWYGAHHSIWLDVTILFATLGVVLFPKSTWFAERCSRGLGVKLDPLTSDD